MRKSLRTVLTGAGFVLVAMGSAACSDDDGVDSDEEARRAYLGLDLSIPKSLQLGFDGYNAASSANIDPQAGVGDETGTLTISGQVAQGTSDNHEMRLYIGMVDYSDCPCTIVINEDEELDVNLTYDTSDVQTEQPYLHLSLRNVPNGTFTGEITAGAEGLGVYHVTGDIEGDVALELSLEGTIRDAGNGVVERVPGETHVFGTATSGDGLYDIDLMI